MPLRFRRRISIAPGFALNLGKRGASLSIGRRGAHVTVGHDHVRETVGLPGSGLSYTHVSHRRRRVRRHGSIGGLLLLFLALWALHGLGVF
ncbi:MAG TPA: DUF4236 domain-containing protein [Stellaceae bacterium]|nr:DUF4236 domain-containing protein [Stellaceae bacterium]